MLLLPLLLLKPIYSTLESQICFLETFQTQTFWEISMSRVFLQAAISGFLVWQNPWLSIHGYAVILVYLNARQSGWALIALLNLYWLAARRRIVMVPPRRLIVAFDAFYGLVMSYSIVLERTPVPGGGSADDVRFQIHCWNWSVITEVTAVVLHTLVLWSDDRGLLIDGSNRNRLLDAM